MNLSEKQLLYQKIMRSIPRRYGTAGILFLVFVNILLGIFSAGVSIGALVTHLSAVSQFTIFVLKILALLTLVVSVILLVQASALYVNELRPLCATPQAYKQGVRMIEKGEDGQCNFYNSFGKRYVLENFTILRIDDNFAHIKSNWHNVDANPESATAHPCLNLYIAKQDPIYEDLMSHADNIYKPVGRKRYIIIECLIFVLLILFMALNIHFIF